MALREERNEQNSQAWRAHFERERLDLSASVEAALVDDGHVLVSQWDEDLNEQEDTHQATGGTALVPPRLSLQSRVLPTVQPERTVTETTDAYQTTSHMIEEEPQSAPPPHLLARLARRFTSSFVAVKPDLSQQQASLASSTQAFKQSALENYQYTPAVKPLSTPAIDPPLVRVIDTVTSPDPLEEEKRIEPHKQHSLKRNGKVRLQTTEQPAITKASLPPRIEEQETGEALLADVRDALNRQQATTILPERSVAYGSGAFEGEQSEAMISNALITASSVVLVTLTTNPGPVVVQYISLQPQSGFTVHLTAPVTMRTTFNYVILAGETSAIHSTF